MYAHTCDVFILILYVCLNTEDNQDFIEIIESFCLFVVVTTIIFIYAHNLSVPKHQTLFMFGVEQADEFRKWAKARCWGGTQIKHAILQLKLNMHLSSYNHIVWIQVKNWRRDASFPFCYCNSSPRHFLWVAWFSFQIGNFLLLCASFYLVNNFSFFPLTLLKNWNNV